MSRPVFYSRYCYVSTRIHALNKAGGATIALAIVSLGYVICNSGRYSYLPCSEGVACVCVRVYRVCGGVACTVRAQLGACNVMGSMYRQTYTHDLNVLYR